MALIPTVSTTPEKLEVLTQRPNCTAKGLALFEAALQVLATTKVDTLIRTTENDDNGDDDDDDGKTITTPTQYLERLFARHGYHHNHAAAAAAAQFFHRRTTPARIDSYDLEITRAVRAGDLEKLRKLHCQDGYSLDACNPFGESLLHMACRRGNADMVRFMTIEAFVRPDVCDDMGRSAFHDVCWSSRPQTETMDVLLQVLPPQGLLVKDKRGHTPFDYAPRKDWNTWLEFLKKREDNLVRWLALTNIMEGGPTLTSG